MPDLPEATEDERRHEDCLMFNDAGDVAEITAWLEAGPTEGFVSHFRARHEASVDGMIAKGLSDLEIEKHAGGGREDAPYLDSWECLLEFYRRALKEGLWVECYIGV